VGAKESGDRDIARDRVIGKPKTFNDTKGTRERWPKSPGLPKLVIENRAEKADIDADRKGSVRRSELGTQFLVRRLQVFRQDARFAYGAHEVYVAEPARQDVHVDVTGDTGAGGFAHVHSQIDSVGSVELAQHAFQLLGERHHLLRCRL
jgi:hypothetical protein